METIAYLLNRSWIVGLSVLILLTPMETWADVPDQISYQGYLTDADGIPLDGEQLIIFSIYNEDMAETPIWGEQQTVDLQDGVFNVRLGANEDLLATHFDTATLFLEIAIFRSGSGWETLSPRQLVTSTAFAIKAGDADTLEGLGASDFAIADHEHDAVYVNTGEADAITSAMVADNAISSSDLAADSVGAGQISTGAVGSSEVADNSLTATDLAEGSVRTSEIADGEVTKADFAKGAVIAAVLGEDGSGSGLDADLLDGNNSSYFSTATHTHDSRYVNATGDTMTGSLTVEGSLSVGTDSATDNDYLYMDSGTAEWLRWDNAQTRFQLSDALNVAVGSLAVGTHDIHPAYNSIGAGTPASTSISNTNDLYIRESVEVGINAYVDGALYVGTNSPDDDDTIYMDGSINEYLRWDESENDFLLSDDLRIAGEYTYNSSRTCHLNLPPAAFNRRGLSDETWIIDPDRAYIWVGGGSAPHSVQVVAPVLLPQGATVTSFRLYYYDDTVYSGTISGKINRSRVYTTRNVVELANIPATYTSGDDNDIDYMQDASIVNAIIDNENYQYAIYVNFTAPVAGLNADLSFCGARVTYTVDRVAN